MDIELSAPVEDLAFTQKARAFDPESWGEASSMARASSTARARRNACAVSYLVGTPMLEDLIDEGLAECAVVLPLPRAE
jgi:hypothetical protein